MSRFINFIEEFLSEFHDTLDLHAPNPYFQISLELMRRHFLAKVTIPTILAEASGVPYATAMRRLNEMVDAGLIEQRPRTRSGKSFTLHPSEKLLSQWQHLFRRVERLIENECGHCRRDNARSDYYFGGSYLQARSIPPLQVLSEPLNVPGGLRVLVHADPVFMVMEKLKRHMEQVIGCPIRQRAFSIDRLRDEVVRNAERKRSLYDIVAVNLPWIGEFAESKVLKPLDEVLDIETLDPPDFHPASWQACHWNGRCYGVPAQTTSELLFYRKDLFAERGLEAPKTTHDLLSVAARLHEPGNHKYGIAWNAARGTPLGHTFLMAMADFGQPIINLPKKAGGFDTSSLARDFYRPLIDSDAGFRAAEFLKELVEYSPPDILSMSWYERMRCYAEGKAAMAFGFTNLVPYFELKPNSPAWGVTGYLPHPAGANGTPIAPVGGYLLSIPNNIAPDRIPAVGRALSLFTSPQAQKLYIQNGSRGSPRYSVGDDPEIQEISPVFEAIDGMSRRDELQTWPRPPIPEIETIIQICGTELHDMLRGVVSVPVALKRAQESANRVFNETKTNTS